MLIRKSLLISSIVSLFIVFSFLTATEQDLNADLITSLAGDKDSLGTGVPVGDAVAAGYAVTEVEDGTAFDQRKIGLAEWTHNYTVPFNEQIISASLTLLTFDIEDNGAGDGMGGAPFDDRLYLDGVEVIGAFDDVFTADGTSALPIAANWLTFNLYPSFYPLMQDGTLTVRLADLGVVGDHFWIDFSELKINTAPVPEPISMLLFGTGLVGIGGYIRKKARRQV